MKNCLLGISALLLLLNFVSCEESEKPDIGNVLPFGISCIPEEPDADKELTVTFRANEDSQLYGYDRNVYVHIGIVSEGQWTYVPADWNQNTDKCRMTKIEDNIWSITLSPTVREWFGSGTVPINRIGLVIRSEDGKLKGIGEDSFITVTDSRYSGFEPAEPVSKAMPSGLVHGINIISDTEAAFVLYDRDRNGESHDYAYIIGDFNGWQPQNSESSQMYRDDDAGCWWISVDSLESGREYAFQYYLMDSDGSALRTGDAYCEKVLDPDNDKYIDETTYPSALMQYPDGARGIVSVFKTVMDEYDWKNESFSIADDDNLIIYELHIRDFTEKGDLNGVMERLDYISALGVNAIELMPVQEFDGNDSWGYNPCYFFAMDKAYGTKDKYKEFIDKCHELGIAVFFDVVYNHATGNMPFAKMYWDSSASKTSPENPWFNVDAPHPYSVFHDFNHESELVRDFVKRNLKFLLDEYHIDGFRFDLTKGFTQKTSNESTAHAYDASRISILKDYFTAIREADDEAVMIIEHFCDDREEGELMAEGIKVWRNANYAFCQSAMGWQDESGFEFIYTGSNDMPFGGYVGFMESHDEERCAYKARTYGNGSIATSLTDRMSNLAVNAALCLSVPGPKMIWQFGELGYDISIDENGRTGRKPILWSYLDDADRHELMETYSVMNRLRTGHPSLFAATATVTLEVGTGNWEEGRMTSIVSQDNKHLIVVGNHTGEHITTAYTIPQSWSECYDCMTGQAVDMSRGERIELNPYSFAVYTNFAP